jgi:GNAT superfamily N-acetyltransferase
VDELDPPIDTMKEALLSRKEYMILSYLAVHPDYQRKGIATLLVSSGVKVAQNMKFDIFVRASDAGLKIYQKVGFQLLGQVIQDDSRFGGNGNYGVYFLEKNCS